MTHRWIAALSVLVLAGCQLDASERRSPDLRVTLDSPAFPRSHPASAAQASFRVQNFGNRPARVAQCGERLMAVLDRREGSRWIAYSGDACPGGFEVIPLELAPGSTVFSWREVHQPGTYRLRLGVAVNGAEAPDWRVISDQFVVE